MHFWDAMIDATFSQLTDSLSTAVVLLDSQRHVVYFNSAAEAFFAKSKLRSLGQPFAGHFQDDRLPSDLDKTLDQPKAYAQREAHWILAHNHELVTVDYMMSDVVMNATVFRLLEIQSLDRLNRIQRDTSFSADYNTTREVVRGLAHEIKNPLGGIRGAAQLLARVTPADQQEYTQVIIDEVDRLKSLVDRMLGPVTQSQVGSVNIHRVLERVYALIEAETQGAIEWIRDYDPSLPEFSGDPEQIQQVLLNIVVNARQALIESHTDRPTLRLKTRAAHQVTLSGALHRLVCQIDIMDNGPGIPDLLKPTVFFPMVSGRAQGSGLGLSLAQQYVSQHRGLIEFTSQPGNTCFTIMLPMETHQ